MFGLIIQLQKPGEAKYISLRVCHEISSASMDGVKYPSIRTGKTKFMAYMIAS